MERGLAATAMNEHESQPVLPADVTPAVVDPFTQFPSEHPGCDVDTDTRAWKRSPQPATGSALPTSVASVSLPGLVAAEERTQPDHARRFALAGRIALQWLGVRFRNAAIAVLGFTCAVLIVFALTSVGLVRRSTPFVRHGVRVFAAVTASCLATLLHVRSSSALLRAALFRRRDRAPVVPLRRYAYPVVFFGGVVVGALVTVGRLPEQETPALPAVASTRTDVVPSSRVVLPLPVVTPVSAQASRPYSPVPTIGVDTAPGAASAAVRVAAMPASPVRNRSVAPARGVSRAAAAARAPARGRSRPPARVLQASEADESTWGPETFLGSVAVGSRPAGAEVFVNGRPVGRTPLLLTDLPVGSRAVRVALDGHEPWSRAIQVVANQRTSVMATLQRSGTD